ncbi:aminoacyl-tRNA deacylase [Corallococcus sp. AB045]|uniref:aminoacyl-tRNA deacylase n=1 Tax=Corallococcus sp. AB045 TaxID=2316719 RepID=UPI001F47AD77|nr:YbaK/EbsC family protein [Corallococcus sp. AB045]
MHTTDEPSRREFLERYLRDSQVAATLINPGSDMPTVPLAAAALGVAPAQIVKTIVFEGKKDASRACLAIAPGDIRIATAKVAAALQLTQLKLASAQTVLRLTGYAVGGVPPVGHATPLPVVIDSRVLPYDVVFGGGGDDQHMLRISPRDIQRLTGAVVADIAAEDAAASPVDAR